MVGNLTILCLISMNKIRSFDLFAIMRRHTGLIVNRYFSLHLIEWVNWMALNWWHLCTDCGTRREVEMCSIRDFFCAYNPSNGLTADERSDWHFWGEQKETIELTPFGRWLLAGLLWASLSVLTDCMQAQYSIFIGKNKPSNWPASSTRARRKNNSHFFFWKTVAIGEPHKWLAFMKP